ncbi:MAG: N-acetylmuramoyl-L-alanine amidase [Candidatus Marinimicrobia bacterium]|nr:N-acetylmuramoyl-L-alanine amidase [Candidatus Neomarinimicrobiota bacterium]
MHYLKFIFVSLSIWTLVPALDLSGIKICLDPGHGGYESDDRPMTETGFWESESNLTKGLFLKQILESYNAQVVITRTGNNGTTDDPSLSERVELANSNSVDYFISIHSNAFDAAQNYSMSIFNGKTESPRIPESKVMSEILCVEVMQADRTNHAVSIGDLTLNPTFTYGYGVLYPATMAANISEGSFHDYIPECWRLQSIDYRKQESWGIARAILQYFEAGEPEQQMLSGVLRSTDELFAGYAIPGTSDKFKTLNIADLLLKSPTETRAYTTDNMNNGFYTFDSLLPGEYTLIATAENYCSDTVNIIIGQENFSFQDFFLVSSIPPFIKSVEPGDGQMPVKGKISIEFSRALDTTDARSKIQFTPAVNFSLSWEKDNTLIKIIPDSLEYESEYLLALSDFETPYSHPLDGNHDGTGGDEFIFVFQTHGYDLEPPFLLSNYPADGSFEVETHPIINVTFNELLSDSGITAENILLQNIESCDIVPSIITPNHTHDKTGITIIPAAELEHNRNYQLVVKNNLTDLSENSLAEDLVITFHTGNTTKKYSILDKFDAGLSNWWQPGQSGSTAGIIPDKTGMKANADTTNPLTLSTKSMEIFYAWDLAKTSWLLREYCPSGLKSFNKERTLEVYLFGDGSMSKFRFCVDDDASTEVSPWFDIDFVGWRLISWDMSTNETGSWIGDGSLTGNLKVDSFQMTCNPISPFSVPEGKILMDDFRLVTYESVAVDGDFTEKPTEFYLSHNYPNPFNPGTRIAFQLPVLAKVELTVFDIAGKEVERIINEIMQPGNYTAQWNAEGHSSGVYLYSIKVVSNGRLLYSKTEKCILMK